MHRARSKLQRFFEESCIQIREQFIKIKEFTICYLLKTNEGRRVRGIIDELLLTAHLENRAIDYRPFVELVQSVERRQKEAFPRDKNSFWHFFDIAQSQVHSSSCYVEPLGVIVNKYASKLTGRPGSHEITEIKSLFGAILLKGSLHLHLVGAIKPLRDKNYLEKLAVGMTQYHQNY